LKPYRFLEEAEAEFQTNCRYYDQQVAGLGDRFAADVDRIITQIREYPQSGALVSRILRKRVLHLFKHNILYVDAQNEIIVIAIAPHRRRTGYWRERMKRLR
jgi:hypothetical protein